MPSGQSRDLRTDRARPATLSTQAACHTRATFVPVDCVRNAIIQPLASRSAHKENNASEYALRGPVIARLTGFGSGASDGARAAGLLFRVLARMRIAGLNP